MDVRQKIWLLVKGRPGLSDEVDSCINSCTITTLLAFFKTSLVITSSFFWSWPATRRFRKPCVVSNRDVLVFPATRCFRVTSKKSPIKPLFCFSSTLHALCCQHVYKFLALHIDGTLQTKKFRLHSKTHWDTWMFVCPCPVLKLQPIGTCCKGLSNAS